MEPSRSVVRSFLLATLILSYCSGAWGFWGVGSSAMGTVVRGSKNAGAAAASPAVSQQGKTSCCTLAHRQTIV